jgi:hypothetical protein
LGADASAILRERLITECTNLQSVDAAVARGRDALKTKNILRSEDAEMLEWAFARRLSELEGHEEPALADRDAQTLADETTREGTEENQRDPARANVSNRVANAGPRRRDKAHLRFVASQACLVCGRKPSEPHHLRFAQPRALGRKVSDEYTVPLCRSHHRDVHRFGNEVVWWKNARIEPLNAALQLWSKTRVGTGRVEPSEVAGQPDGADQQSTKANRTRQAKEVRKPTTLRRHDAPSSIGPSQEKVKRQYRKTCSAVSDEHYPMGCPGYCEDGQQLNVADLDRVALAISSTDTACPRCLRARRRAYDWRYHLWLYCGPTFAIRRGRGRCVPAGVPAAPV